jgi:hypothetical protein
MKKIFFTCIMMATCVVVLLNVANFDALAKGGCARKFNKCIRALEPIEKCEKEYDACAADWKDKKACIADCRQMKKEAKALCRETFNETKCGPKDRKCKKERRQQKKKCLRNARKNCRKACS